MMKRLRRGAWLVVFASAAWAVDWTAYKPEGYVSDFAKVIDPASKTQLEAYSATVRQATGVQMALVTVPSLEGEPIEDVANTIARAWGVGQKGKNEGILLLLAVQDRRSRLEIGYGLEPILPDGLAGSVLREMRPALRQQHYGEALKAAADTLGTTIAKAKNVPLNANLPRRIQRTPTDSIPWPMIVGGVFLLLWLMRAGAARGYSGRSTGGFLPGLILGNIMGRSTWGSRGSGGFGGYDSSDGGFGGFGIPRLDILVNSAGIGLVGNIEETELPDFERLLRVNVSGTFLVSQAAMPKLLESRGCIVNVGSVAGLVGVKRRFAYCATKGAVIALTRQMAVDYAGRLRVNCVCPGTVETPFVEGYLEKFHKHEKDKVRAELHARQPVGRMGRPDEIASLVLYLCSSEAEFVTGSAVTIDGGWTAA